MGNYSLNRISSLIFLVVISLLFFNGIEVKAQLPVPVMNCVSVEDDGSLSVNWSVTGSVPFDGFRIFYKPIGSTLPVPYREYLNTFSSGVIPVLDGQTVGYEIFMMTFTDTPPQISLESNHLRSMMLTVSNAGTGSGIARLDWDRIQAGNNGVFNIYRKDNALAPFPVTPIGQTNGLIFYDTITSPYCTATDIYYRVEFSSGGCVANTSVGSGSFFDDNLPEDPVLSLVTINTSGFAEISWENSPTMDVNGYIVGLKEGASFTDHFTLGYVTSFVDDQTALPTYQDPCSEMVTYVVRAEDLCTNQSSGAINYQFPHNTILLAGETTTLCDRKATLEWNAYKNMDPEVSSYKVYRSENGGPDTEIANIDAGSGDFTFVDPELLTPGVQYTYQVAAVNSDVSKISRSCRVPLVPDPEPFTQFELDYVTVTDNDYIDLHINSNPPELISTIEVWRSAIDGSSVELLFNMPWDGFSPVSVSDESAEVNETSYFYSVSALDACGFPLGSTGISRSIFVQIEDIGNDRYRLSWNAYEDWGSSLLEYNIYRVADGVVEAGFPVSVPPGQLTFDDFAGNLVANRTTYYIEAVRNDNLTSRSNEVLLPADAEVVIANAFRPDGITPVFKPKVKNIEPGSYLFAIYNRWGQLVFSTNNPETGWNGLSYESEASQDIYAWILTFEDLTGKKVSKSGSVFLLR
ncbi:MAG: gliding motility-associated C-terminal domain-containing protein [Bacteroidales bacterium]|nr:gliding motility-associated C-terminal domain-containing protein [Bacteroidales bacterium]